MRSDLKQRRSQSYLQHKFDDYTPEPILTDDNDIEIIAKVIHFFATESKIEFPAKSYFVAIIYALCMEKYFNVPFIVALDDNDLLIDDKCFVPYSENDYVYDKIIDSMFKCFNLNNLSDILYNPSTFQTHRYFREEFLIDPVDIETDI